MAQPKRFELYRPGKMHYIDLTGRFAATQAWVDAEVHGYDGTPTVTTDHPISHIKSVADEVQQDAAGEAFFDKRITVIIGTLDPKIAGQGWSEIPAGTNGTIKTGYILQIFMDEADYLEGNFDYVELQDDADDCAIIAYETNY
jgi:hypothetical protein